MSGLDIEQGRVIGSLQYLDNLGGNLPQRSIIDNDLWVLDRRRLWVRLRCIVERSSCSANSASAIACS